MELSKQEIYKRLSKKTFLVDRDIIIDRLAETQNRSLEYCHPLIIGKITGYERNDNLGLINPLIWEFGHIVFFWERIAKLLDLSNNEDINDSRDIYDSFIVKREDRWLVTKETINEILARYYKVMENIVNKIKNCNYNPSICYLVLLGLYHNEWHNESFLFTRKLLNMGMPKSMDLYIKDREKLIDFKFISIHGGQFRQGVDDDSNGFVLDNEMPSFKVEIQDFEVSKYPITQFQYLLFVRDDGYNEEKYWCKPGWRWIKQNNIDKPLYWKKINGLWKIKNNDNRYEKIKNNHPMIHVSWYEACAFCRYISIKLDKKIRLPTESEWEFVANKYGDLSNCNANYSGNTVSVANDKENTVSQLFGNVWEWCQEPIYPYDGFVIDPVYREVSYPFFGFKKICKGGCWATSDYMISSSYRNAQQPDCRYQFIGFRVVNELLTKY